MSLGVGRHRAALRRSLDTEAVPLHLSRSQVITEQTRIAPGIVMIPAWSPLGAGTIRCVPAKSTWPLAYALCSQMSRALGF